MVLTNPLLLGGKPWRRISAYHFAHSADETAIQIMVFPLWSVFGICAIGHSNNASKKPNDCQRLDETFVSFYPNLSLQDLHDQKTKSVDLQKCRLS